MLRVELSRGESPLEIVLGDEHAARLRALVRRDDPAPLEHVDQPARARVADAQTALEQRDRRGLRGDDDLDRPVEQRILVGVELALVAVAVVGEHLRQLEEALVDLLLALARVCSTMSAISSSVTNAPWTRCRREVPSGLKSMSPWPSRLSAPFESRITRESVCEETANAIRDGTFALIIPVITSTDGRCVASTRWMPTARDFCASRMIGVLDLLRADHHQVGELVDHDQQVRQLRLAALAERAVRLGQVAGAHAGSRRS